MRQSDQQVVDREGWLGVLLHVGAILIFSAIENLWDVSHAPNVGLFFLALYNDARRSMRDAPGGVSDVNSDCAKHVYRAVPVIH